MPLEDQRQLELRNGGRLYEPVSTEEMCRRGLVPAIDIRSHTAKLGIRLKSVHMPSSSSQYRQLTGRLHSETSPFYENIVVPLTSKHEELTQSFASKVNRCSSRGGGTNTPSLPYVSTSRATSCRQVVPYYADNLPPVTPGDRKQRLNSSVWTLTNQPTRLENEMAALNRCRSLKRTAEIIPHRVDRQYNMSGATKKIHMKYEVTDEALRTFESLTHRHVQSRLATPSARNTSPIPVPIQSPSKPRSPYGKKVRKLGHIKAYTLEQNRSFTDGHSYIMCPEYIVPYLYEMPYSTVTIPDLRGLVNTDTPPAGNDYYQSEISPNEDLSGEITLGDVLDQEFLSPEPVRESKRKPAERKPECVWVKTHRCWSDSDLRFLEEKGNVLDVLNVNEKMEYNFKVPQKKFIPTSRCSNSSPTPRCCSNFARRKYPSSKVLGLKSGRNCKSTFGCWQKTKSGKKSGKRKPELTSYQIKFRPDNCHTQDMIMATKLVEGEKIENVEEEVLYDQYPVRYNRPRQVIDNIPVKCECRVNYPQTGSMLIKGHTLQTKPTSRRKLA